MRVPQQPIACVQLTVSDQVSVELEAIGGGSTYILYSTCLILALLLFCVLYFAFRASAQHFFTFPIISVCREREDGR